MPTPWLPQDPTTLTLYGAYEEGEPPRTQPSQSPDRPVPPRPAYGQSQDGHEELKQVLLSLGVSRDGLPLRLGVRAGHPSDSIETPVAMEECGARAASTGCAALWRIVRPTVNARWGCV
jgi:hypothetical protein